MNHAVILVDVICGAAVRIADRGDKNMNIVWKYKIELADKNVFGEIEKERGILIPEELKKLVIEANAATPDKYNFMVGPTERVFGAILSFNKNEEDTDTVFTALEVIDNKMLFPFAIDPFGNYICMNLTKKEVVFWNHETGDISSTGKSLEDLLNNLY